MEKILSEIKKILNQAGVEGEIELTSPPNPEMGDFAFACFGVAKVWQMNPVEAAKKIQSQLLLTPHALLTKVVVMGPYVNFYFNSGKVADIVIKEILKKGKKYGVQAKKKERVMVEYSQPNTHKEFHIGHLRNVCIGSSIVNIFKHSGYKTIGANYIGDIGAHVAKCLWYIETYKKDDLRKVSNPGKWLGQMYAEASQKIEAEPDLKESVAEVQRKLESGDKYWLGLWKKTKKWSMQEFKGIYKQLGVDFDEWFFESEVEKPGKEMVAYLLKHGIAQRGEGGAVIVDLNSFGLDIFLILKSDGSSLYATKDLALAALKFKKFRIDKSIYVIDNRQRHYFMQLFKTLELMGWKKDVAFLGYDFVTLPEGAMASRKGNVVLFNDLLADVESSVVRETKERHSDWKEKNIKDVARKIALAAIKFDILKHPIDKVIVFNKEEALSFEGFTGPYILYVVARINSMLSKANSKSKIANHKFELLDKSEEKQLVLWLGKYEEVVKKALAEYNPSVITRYCFDLAQAFNNFYNNCSILKAETKDLMFARLSLSMATKNVLESALGLLTIDTVEEM